MSKVIELVFIVSLAKSNPETYFNKSSIALLSNLFYGFWRVLKHGS